MTQVLNPLWGDYISSQSVARGNVSTAAILIKPKVTFTPGSPYVLNLAPETTLTTTVFAWLTAIGQANPYGSYVITEDATININVPGSDGKYWLVGRWKWQSGPVDMTGHPTGEFTTGMHAVYSIENAPSDWIGTGTEEEPQLGNRFDVGTGLYGVILGRITVASGVPTFDWEPSTMTDPAWIGTQIADLKAQFAQAFNPITIRDSVVTANYYTLTIANGVLTQTLVP